MFGFIEILKAIAAMLITNSHFSHIWPIPDMATGGMLGDVLFFAVSGFCLYNIKTGFLKWYAKRIFRIYPVVWVVSGIAVLIGYMKVSSFVDAIKLFVYPTYYHFIASIMLLYIIYYVLIWMHYRFAVKIEYFMFAVFVVQLFCYLVFYDKSVYHIDTVEEYMARFLFLESMLLGAYFRKTMSDNRAFSSRNKIIAIILMPVMLITYFAA